MNKKVAWMFYSGYLISGLLEMERQISSCHCSTDREWETS